MRKPKPWAIMIDDGFDSVYTTKRAAVAQAKRFRRTFRGEHISVRVVRVPKDVLGR